MKRHAALSVIKAAAVTIPLVCEVERHFAAGQTNIRFVRGSLNTFVGLAPGHEGEVSDFLRRAVAHIDQSLVSVELSAKESGRVERLKASLLERAQASEAAADASLNAQRQLSQALPVLIPEIGETFDFAAEVASDLLSHHDLYLPRIDRATGKAPALAGSCEPIDTAEELVSDVTLLLPETGLELSDLYSIPYILVHELVCHAGQGLRGPYPRSPSGVNCAWSDGWMDCFAWELTKGWLAGGRTIAQQWIAEARVKAAVRAEAAHQERYRGAVGSALARADQSARIEAKEAWTGLARAGIAAGLGEDEAVELRRAFSVRYNACNLPQSDRQELVANLLTSLQERELETLNLVQDFVASSDPFPLQRALAA